MENIQTVPEQLDAY
jgi:hypothetical protein